MASTTDLESECDQKMMQDFGLISGTVTILCMQWVRVRWEKWGELALAAVALLVPNLQLLTILVQTQNFQDCALLLMMAKIHNLILAYIFYILFRVLYQMMITIAQYNLARKMKTQSFGLVFGFNSFIALFLQTCLTLAVADHHGLHLEIHTQFVVYGLYHGAIGIVFLTMGLLTLWAFKNRIAPVPKEADETEIRKPVPDSEAGQSTVEPPKRKEREHGRHHHKHRHHKHKKNKTITNP